MPNRQTQINLNKFIIDNYLQDYYNDKSKLNYDFALYYAHCYFDKTQNIEEKEIYANYIRKYIDVVTDKINKRADRMIIDLKKIINEES